MPARRSRTVNWQDSLHRICERGGPIEVTIDTPASEGPDAAESCARNIIWRVRILEVIDGESLVIEKPSALGAGIELVEGIHLVGIMTVGQNRWMFRTKVIAPETFQLSGRTTVNAYRLTMPAGVERCQRRNFYRVSTVQLALPAVTCGQVLDHDEARLIEATMRTEIQRMYDSEILAKIEPDTRRAELMPPVGASCHAQLVNIGGGGVGLIVLPEDEKVMDRGKLLWLSIDLRPQVPAPLGVLARVRHIHIESNGAVYAGLSFDFGTDQRHARFVSDLLCRFSADVQREQMKRGVATGTE